MNAIAKIESFENLKTFSNHQEQIVWPQSELLPAISVIGLGYVGAVSTACLAGLGHRVVGCDVDAIKTKQIADGVSPIHEKGLGELLASGVAEEKNFCNHRCS